MALKARILYDFDGDAENGELVVSEGAVLTIINQDIGDGWWEGQLPSGECGLFPESYCEIISDGGAAAPAPVNQVGGQYSQQDWGDDDDWDNTQQDGFDDPPMEREGARSLSPGERSASFSKAGTVRKNINRFSPFVKTGTEAFVLGAVSIKSQVTAADQIKIVISPEGVPMWEPNPDPYTVEVRDPEKKSKFKGIKSFMAYSIVPSSTGRPVSRRYKHYDWLHDRLEEKFTALSVPPLPDKQYYGRYGEEFVEKRREKLQMWSNRVARHPVLSRSEVIVHFFLCDDEGSQWKAGKRRAEKDEFIGQNFFPTIQHPEVTIDLALAEAATEHFGMFLLRIKASLSKMRVKFIDHCNQMSGVFMGEFHKMAGVITGVAQSFELEKEEYARSLTEAMLFTGDTYREIGALHAEQPRNDMLPSLDILKEYLGLIHHFPDVVQIHRGVAGKAKDCDKMKEEGRIDYTDASDITTRSEIISAALMAEIYHFQHERVVDFRDMMKFFLTEQIRFYQEIVTKLEAALARYHESTDL